MVMGRSELLKLCFGDVEAEGLLQNIHTFETPFFPFESQTYGGYSLRHMVSSMPSVF